MNNAFFEGGSLRVKICGVTCAEDAATVVSAGADAIGINLYPGSKRFVEMEAVAPWVRELPLTRVAVVVNADAALVDRIVAADCFDAIQFHGDESPAFCAATPCPWLRAVRVSGPEALADALGYETAHLLLDAFAVTGYGGTGNRLDLDLAARFVRGQPGRRITLAGGLQPDTVAAAVRTVTPHGVDVASGVETPMDPRRKDAAKVRDFVAAARSGAGC